VIAGLVTRSDVNLPSADAVDAVSGRDTHAIDAPAYERVAHDDARHGDDRSHGYGTGDVNGRHDGTDVRGADDRP
jgi:hypothetical protein